ncbi:MAG: flagellar motor switch protein FliG [Methylococcales bacterium]|jgi:flagellar motor switch protein FliG|nr:flagellar motor switch protein FliG [Methylococcales bacterium]MBT7410053.1 flagellar motor switch protein FliG [Methylococcales bacterium]
MAEVDVSSLTGVERAAILLMSVGEETAAEVLKHMGPKEVQRLGTAMAELNNVKKDHQVSVLDDFITVVDEQTALGVDSDEYIRNVLNNALGSDKATNVIDRILLGRNSKGLEQLKWMDPRAIAEMIRLEHPQIISIILSYLDPDQGAEVLMGFSERVRHDILLRIATLDGIQPQALQELDAILERQFSGKDSVKSSTIGGVKTAADILNLMDSAAEGDIMEKIKDVDPDLGQQIEDKMFVFDDLAEIDDRGMQALLRDISNEILLVALKGADQALKDKIFDNMSKRAAEMLKDDLEAQGPVKLKDVENAQKEILGIARRMSESGAIALTSGGGDEYV